MTEFMVEVTTAPVSDGDWTTHLRAVDSVPGTFLVEDTEEPLLVFPVTADDPMKAARFVEGVADLLGLTITSGSIEPAPVLDFEAACSDDNADTAPESERVAAVTKWAESVHGIRDNGCNAGLVNA